MVTATRTLEIELPPLHRGRDGLGQVEIFHHKARFKVIICGRRWGKTTLGITKCLETGLQGGLVWWVAPTYKVARPGWRMLSSIASQIPGAKKHEQDHYVELPGGGEVWIKSADDPDSLRGEGLHGVVFDEFAQTKEETWYEVIRPALSDHRGWAIFIGTPKGKNWCWRLFQRGLTGDPNWQSWKKPTSDNPYIDPEEIEQARLEMLEAEFKQEYEADFGASQLQVYPEFDRYLHIWKRPIPKFVQFFGGLDFAGDTIGAHKSAGSISGMTEDGVLIVLKEFKQSGSNITERQLEWVSECELELHSMQKRLGHSLATFHWRADRSQSAFISLAKNLGYSIWKSTGGAKSVQNGVNLVQRRLEFRPDGLARIYYLNTLVNFPEDMEKYRYPNLKSMDEVQPENPLKVDDDLMDAVRYMVEGADQFVVGDPMELYKNALAVVK